LWIDCYATVEDLVWVDVPEQARALAGLHCWTPETVMQRFVYGKRPGLYLFILRAYRLPQSYTVPILKRYSGCRSWVELEEPLNTVGALPVLDDVIFAQQVRAIKSRLSLHS
jgi:hypothetical protein